MLALELKNDKYCEKIVKKLLTNGIITFYFLFNRNNVRISPPLLEKYLMALLHMSYWTLELASYLSDAPWP